MRTRTEMDGDGRGWAVASPPLLSRLRTPRREDCTKYSITCTSGTSRWRHGAGQIRQLVARSGRAVGRGPQSCQPPSELSCTDCAVRLVQYGVKLRRKGRKVSETADADLAGVAAAAAERPGRPGQSRTPRRGRTDVLAVLDWTVPDRPVRLEPRCAARRPPPRVWLCAPSRRVTLPALLIGWRAGQTPSRLSAPAASAASSSRCRACWPGCVRWPAVVVCRAAGLPTRAERRPRRRPDRRRLPGEQVRCM